MIDPEKYNAMIDALSAARPIACGGTGAHGLVTNGNCKLYRGPDVKEVELANPDAQWTRYPENPTIKVSEGEAFSEAESFHDSEFVGARRKLGLGAKVKSDSKPFFPDKIGRIDKLPRF